MQYITDRRYKDMKRYFIDGIEVTQEEAQKQEAINNAILNIKDDKKFLQEAIKARFIVIIDK